MKGSVLVVGAGPAGMRACAELVNQGFKVILVEEKPTIGGKMAQIDKMFPSNECSTCTILPKMLELTSDPNVTLVSFADVESIEGEAGDFKVRVTKKTKICRSCKNVRPARIVFLFALWVASRWNLISGGEVPKRFRSIPPFLQERL